MVKSLKYESLIKSLSLSIDCPGSEATQYAGVTFRWFRADWEIETNFLPNLHEPRPQRIISNDHIGCDLCALSLYNTLEAAIAKFNSFPLNTKRKLGHTHVYKGEIDKGDGIASEATASGHINFYEYLGIDICNKFVPVCVFDKV